MTEKTTEKALTIIDRCGLFFFAVLLFLLPISNAAIESCFGFIFMCVIAKAIVKKAKLSEVGDFFRNRINLAVLIFYLAIGLSMFVSPSFTKSFEAWFFKWGEGVLLFYFAQVLLKNKDLKVLLGVFLISGFLICVDGIYQKLTGTDFIRGFELSVMSTYTAVIASFRHYNDFGTFLIVLFFVAFGFLNVSKRLLVRSGIYVLLILALINLFLTYSRGAWLSFLLVCLVFLIFYPSKRAKLLLTLAAVSFILIIIRVPSLRERLLFTLTKAGDSDRFRIWGVALAMFRDSPILGKGLGFFLDSIRQYNARIQLQYAHNCYIQLLAETGIVGLISFLWLLFEIVKSSFHKIMKDKTNFLFLGLFLAFIAFLINAFFDTQLFSLKSAILFWMLLSFISLSLKPAHETNKRKILNSNSGS